MSFGKALHTCYATVALPYTEEVFQITLAQGLRLTCEELSTLTTAIACVKQPMQSGSGQSEAEAEELEWRHVISSKSGLLKRYADFPTFGLSILKGGMQHS